MELTSDNLTLAENKVLILYILSKINTKVTNDILYKLLISIIDMNYFYFQQFILELIKNKYIENYVGTEVTSYKITRAGITTLELTKDLLPGIVKLHTDNVLKTQLKPLQMAYTASTEFIPKHTNDFILKCRISEGNETIFEVSTIVGSIDTARSLSKNWEENANSLYPEILKLLYNEQDKNKKDN